MKHTKALLLQCLHAYNTSPIRIDSISMTTKILSIHENGNIKVAHAMGNQDVWNVEYIQLLLTPLSAISDVDAVEVAKMCQWHPDAGDDFENIIADFDCEKIERCDTCIKLFFTCICFVGCVKIDFIGNIWCLDEEENSEDIWMTLRITDYLRSKSYDCGYAHIPSLIEAGIAANATTL